MDFLSFSILFELGVVTGCGFQLASLGRSAVRAVYRRVLWQAVGARMTEVNAGFVEQNPDDVGNGVVPPRKRQRKLSTTGCGAERRELSAIELTKEESELINVLKKTVEKYGIKTEVRIAGGWVRDKLLGKSSNDIDVALDDMTGASFATLVNEYMKDAGHKTHRVGVIQANPEQSKHLETATISVLGLDVDFVNLRSEEYVDTSRIPHQVVFGTALEDAERRDFTINSLFYNVTKGELEDLTGKGVEDLKMGVIRTPLAPARTFRDDPLRMLRAVRFASRFGFTLDKEVEAALGRLESREALAHKISRERVGTELSSMLRGAHPQRSLDLLVTFGMMPLVLSVPEYPLAANPPARVQRSQREEELMEQDGVEDGSLAAKALAKADWLFRVKLAGELRSEITANRFGSLQYSKLDLEPEFIDLVALLHGFSGIHMMNSKLKPEAVDTLIIRDSLKFKSNLASEVHQVCASVGQIAALAESMERGNQSDTELRVATGRLLFDLQGLTYVAMCLVSILYPERLSGVAKMNELIRGRWSMATLWSEPMVFNGKDLIQVLDFPKGGPYIGELMALQRDWVITNRPCAGTCQDQRRQACKEYLFSMKDKAMRDVEQKRIQQQLEKEGNVRKRKEERAKALRERQEAEEKARHDLSMEDKPQPQ